MYHRLPIPQSPASPYVIRNGPNHSATVKPLPRLRLLIRRRPKKGPVPDTTKDLIRRLLQERMALRAIARATGVSRSWLQRFVNDLYRDATPWEPGPLKKNGRPNRRVQ